ncbi:hypothetical protein [Niabella beijingensis]|uniref:hypothetical protein n=1 Tax=Niabella beijingensis TaxID=2872700 RepID=UPI001CC109FE|nr:hypothetical protein [Niabella beijingensis]MBZ4192421.1 hypothetical protein [Niabella beijingensis]
MKLKLTITLLFLLNVAGAQTIAFFGEAVCKTKLRTLYYRFDDEKFTAQQSIPIQMSAEYRSRFTNSYRVNFDEKTLRQHNYLYFSDTTAISEDSALVRQNRINLTELFITLNTLSSNSSNVNINKISY